MGNLFSKETTTEREQEQTKTLDWTKDNLELYLNDVYERECEFKIDSEEVNFLRVGIETLTQRIVDIVLKDDTLQEYIEDMFEPDTCVNGLVLVSDLKQTLTDYIKSSLQEVYIPLKRGSTLSNISHAKRRKSTIIKVGSFYEGTKNGFPDEFDFIFLLFSGTEKPPSGLSDFYLIKAIHQLILNITVKNKHLLKYISNNRHSRGKRKLIFDKFVRTHGPAAMLQFSYENSSGKELYIHVDLVPANRITDGREVEKFLKRDGKSRSKSFCDETLSLGKCLYVHDAVSFTETEVHFMKNVLSKKHLKVYRILKYLINGHGDDEQLEEMNECVKKSFNFLDGLDKYPSGYSSYMIKTMIISHHEKCTNKSTLKIGPCVIQVLQRLYTYKSPENLLKSKNKKYEEFCLLPYVAEMTRSLISMQTSLEKYSYEKVLMKSMARQYLDDSPVTVDELKGLGQKPRVEFPFYNSSSCNGIQVEAQRNDAIIDFDASSQDFNESDSDGDPITDADAFQLIQMLEDSSDENDLDEPGSYEELRNTESTNTIHDVSEYRDLIEKQEENSSDDELREIEAELKGLETLSENGQDIDEKLTYEKCKTRKRKRHWNDFILRQSSPQYSDNNARLKTNIRSEIKQTKNQICNLESAYLH